VPRKAEHIYAGLTVSALAESVRMRDLPPHKAGAEMIGAMVGGYYGSRAPDFLDPPVKPKHWGVAHSATAGAAVFALATAGSPKIQNELRVIADECFAQQAYYADEDRIGLALLYGLAGLAFYGLAGFVASFAVAYLSHLALDHLECKSSLPLICRGC